MWLIYINQAFANHKRLFYFFVLLIHLSAVAQLSRTHYLPPIHAADDGYVSEHYLYLSTPEEAPFLVFVTHGDGTPIAGSPFTISNGNPVNVELGVSEDTSEVFVNEAELNIPIATKGLVLNANKLFYASLRTANNFQGSSSLVFLHAAYLTCKGTSALGNSFRVGSIPISQAEPYNNFFSSIMATEDNTTVTISGYDAGVEFADDAGAITDDEINIVLNAGESYVVSGRGDVLANADGFIGALIVADKPVAVNTGNYAGGFATNGFTDTGIDQIVPITDIGQEYIAIRGSGSQILEKLIVVAVSDNTDVFVNGSTTAYNSAPLNAGDYLIIEADQYQGTSNRNMYVNTSEPAYLYQSLGGGTSDATTGFNYIPTLTCFFIKEINEIPDVNKIGDFEYTGNLAIVTTTGSTLTVNGAPVTATAQAVLGTAAWETYRVNNLSGNVSVSSTGPLSVAFYGTNRNAGFSGYYSSFGLSPTGNTDVGLCTDEPVDLLSFVDGFPEPGGVWTPALASNSSIFDPSLDAEGVYNYVSTTSCNTIDITITVQKRPLPILPEDFMYNLCDDDSDGLVDFDLESRIEAILDGQTDIFVSFHETEEDANTLENVLPSPYNGEAKTIYVRLQDELSDCVSIGTIALGLGSSQSEDLMYALCDAGDGTADFDLESQIEAIQNGATELSVSFYISEDDAENALRPINASLPFNSDGETLYTRAENMDACFSIGTLELSIGTDISIPEDLVYALCDDDEDSNASNGFVNFDLDSQIEVVLDGQTNGNVTFYETEEDAEDGVDLLASSYYSDSKTIYARLEFNDACYTVGELQLVVHALPAVPTETPAYSVCNVNEAEENTFDLSTQMETLLNGQTDITLTFYDSETNAENAVDPLGETYTTVDTTIYVRFEHNTTACAAVSALELNSFSAPAILPEVTYALCDADNSGTADFDLQTQIDAIRMDNSDLDVSFYTNQANADAGTNAIDDSILFTSSGEVLITRVDSETCFNTGTLTLRIGDGPVIPENLSFSECSDTVTAEFNLNDHIEAIRNNQTGAEVSFYEFENDANTKINALPNLYASTSKTIYTRLELAPDCFSVGVVALTVNQGPDVIVDLNYKLCDDANDGFETFDLESQKNDITAGQLTIEVSFFESEAEALRNENSIPNNYFSESKTIYTRLEDTNTGCSSIGSIKLVVGTALETILEETYSLCGNEQNPLVVDATPINPGSYTYTWSPTNPNVDGAGEESAVYTIAQGGSYSVSIVSDTIDSCDTTHSFDVALAEAPVITQILGASETFTIDTNSVIEVVTQTNENFEYSLDNGVWQTSPVFTTVSGGSHSVYVRDVNGCNLEDSRDFELILFKPFFTPNNDGINDTWRIEGLTPEHEAQIFIYDRFGKLLKQLFPEGEGWDGTYNGKNLPVTDYWVLINFTLANERKSFKSHISLIR